MQTPRRTPSAKDMRAYFADIGFTLRHRPATSHTLQTWWLADGDGEPYPMPAAFRPGPGQPILGPMPEADGFPSRARLWRAWATTMYRFAREVHCVELIKQRVSAASEEERREVVRWVRSAASRWPDSFEANAPSLDIDGKEVDERVWPWSAMMWHDSLPGLVAKGWPWTTVPMLCGDGLAVQRLENWSERAKSWCLFDTRYPDTYFAVVRTVLGEVLPELVHDAEDDGKDAGHQMEGMAVQAVDAGAGDSVGVGVESGDKALFH